MIADTEFQNFSATQLLLAGAFQIAVVLLICWFCTRRRRSEFRIGRVAVVTLLCIASALPFAVAAWLLWPWDWSSWIVRVTVVLVGLSPLVAAFVISLAKMTTKTGRAYLTLLRADRFAVGRIGASARISPAQRALALLVHEGATDTMLELLERASLAGRLYALLGLSLSHYARIGDLLADYRQRTDEVSTQTACFISSQPLRDIVARIEDGTYAGLLHMDTTEA